MGAHHALTVFSKEIPYSDFFCLNSDFSMTLKWLFGQLVGQS